MDVPAADRRLVRAYPRLIGAVACAVLATLLLLAEVVLLVVSPRRSATAAVPYRQGASLTYGATVAPSHVYPDGSVSTGQPVYPDQVPDLPVQVGYVLSSAAPASVHGQIGLTADVTIGGVPGAHFVLAAPQSFTGSSAHVGGTLPVGTIVEQADAVGGQGGAPASGVQVQIRPTVTVEGTLGATPVKTSFGPAIVLTRNSGAFVPLTVSAPGAPPVTAAQQLAPAAQGALARPVTVPRHVDLLVAHPTVGGLRVASAVLFLLLGGGAAWLGLPFLKDPRRIADARDETSRFEQLLVPIDPATVPGGTVVQLLSLKSVMDVARRYESLVLHARYPNGESFSVWDNGLLHQYRRGEVPEAGGPEVASPPPRRRRPTTTTAPKAASSPTEQAEESA